MCRLLGYTAPTPTTFNDVVGKNFDEFINLSTDHCDGWGIASSESNKASLYIKSQLLPIKVATLKMRSHPINQMPRCFTCAGPQRAWQ
jgi:predicted glutamine amidotransferase